MFAQNKKRFAPLSRCLRKPKRFAPPCICLHKPKSFFPRCRWLHIPKKFVPPCRCMWKPKMFRPRCRLIQRAHARLVTGPVRARGSTWVALANEHPSHEHQECMYTWHLLVEDLGIPSPWPSFFDILFLSVRRGSFPIPLTTCVSRTISIKVLLCAFSESVVRWSRKGKYWVKEIACEVVFAFETVLPLQKEKFQDHNCSNLQQWNVAILQVWPTGLRRSPFFTIWPPPFPTGGNVNEQRGAKIRF
jgi:hypothetical protein